MAGAGKNMHMRRFRVMKELQSGQANRKRADDPADDPVVAQEQEITVKAANKKLTGDSIKKSKKTFKIGASAMTDISYKVMNGSKYVSVSKKGVVTVKKNTPAGTYKICHLK